MSDAELLTRFVRDKDRGALADIVRRYERLVWSVCQRTLNNPVDVEDAFQTTFLTLTANAARIRKRKSLSNWLFGVARRTSLNIRKQRAVSLLDDMLENSGHVVDKTDSTLHAIRRQNEIDLVDQQLTAMATTHRTPLILKYFSGMTAQQIADQMNLSVSAVEGRLRRARAQLRLALQRAGLGAEHRSLLGNPHGANCFGLALIGFASRPELVASTISNCVTASAGSLAGLTTESLTTGAKLMICKTFCAAAIVTLSGVFMLFSGAAEQPTSALVFNTVDVAENSTDDNETTVAIETTPDECCTWCECCADDCCPGACLLDAAHSHIFAAHTALGASLYRVQDWIHGSSEE